MSLNISLLCILWRVRYANFNSVYYAWLSRGEFAWLQVTVQFITEMVIYGFQLQLIFCWQTHCEKTYLFYSFTRCIVHKLLQQMYLKRAYQIDRIEYPRSKRADVAGRWNKRSRISIKRLALTVKTDRSFVWTDGSSVWTDSFFVRTDCNLFITDGLYRSNVCKTISNGLKNRFNAYIYRLNGY